VPFRLEVYLTPADVGRRVVIRWRRPGASGDQVADVLGILETSDDASFCILTARGEAVVIARERALAGKVIEPSKPRVLRPGA